MRMIKFFVDQTVIFVKSKTKTVSFVDRTVISVKSKDDQHENKVF